MKKAAVPNPETRLAVIRRYLHILALLQNNRDPFDWNGAALAELLMAEEGYEKEISDKTVRDYIKKHLKKEIGLAVSTTQGGRRTELAEPLEEDLLMRIAMIYTSFIISDSSREIILQRLIGKHPYDALWLLARLHFAAVKRRKVIFTYTNNRGFTIRDTEAHPYHLVFRNNNLYLAAHSLYHDTVVLYIVNRIDNLRVTDTAFNEEIPPVNEIFRDTLGSFIGGKYRVRLRFTREVHAQVEEILSILDPVVTAPADGRHMEMEFTVSDDRYLCKQLFLYGDQVEILEPPEMREMMVSMLKESLGVYKNK